MSDPVIASVASGPYGFDVVDGPGVVSLCIQAPSILRPARAWCFLSPEQARTLGLALTRAAERAEGTSPEDMEPPR